MKTTYFANAKKLSSTENLVSIARITPKGFPGRIALELAPPSELLWRTKKTGDTDHYTVEFKKLLDKLNPHDIVEKYGEDAIFVCYEGKEKFCHRHLVADWLREYGYIVELSC